ncbi:MAG: hypothetical protein DHS20C16_32110 [Phycisphaerae bacterium]|nr:MAG: hypothetical protein DHS20C16_32110 [Phycisphaerae bacterium]
MLTCCVFGVASSALGETYRDDRNHFTITVPDGWVAIAPETIEMVNATIREQMRNSKTQGVEHDAGFQLEGTPPLAYPYFLVQGIRQDFSEMSYSALERGLGVGVEDGVQEASEAFSEFMDNAEIGKPILDREKGRIMTSVEMDVVGVGEVKGISVGWLSKDGIMNIHCYARASDFDKWAPTFETITNSLQFDEGYKFKPKMNSVLSSAMRGAIIGGVVGGLGSLIFAGVRASKKKKAA